MIHGCRACLVIVIIVLVILVIFLIFHPEIMTKLREIWTILKS